MNHACYSAATPHGPAQLALDAPVRHAADAAIALHRCDALLRALDAWTGIELDWRWPADDTIALATYVGVDVPRGCLALPWPLLRALPAPEGELAGWLQWPSLPAVLAACPLTLPGDELALLEPGGAVLLPASAGLWLGRVRAQDEPAGAGVPVALAPPHAPTLAPRDAASPVKADLADALACEIRLELPAPLPADRLAGWHPGHTLAAGPRASLWHCADDKPLAIGRLMPWADGWALAIDGVARADHA